MAGFGGVRGPHTSTSHQWPLPNLPGSHEHVRSDQKSKRGRPHQTSWYLSSRTGEDSTWRKPTRFRSKLHLSGQAPIRRNGRARDPAMRMIPQHRSLGVRVEVTYGAPPPAVGSDSGDACALWGETLGYQLDEDEGEIRNTHHGYYLGDGAGLVSEAREPSQMGSKLSYQCRPTQRSGKDTYQGGLV